MFFGYRIMAGGSLFGLPLNLTFGKYGQQVVSSQAYADALAVAQGDAQTYSFFQKFGQMFTRSLPDGLDPELLKTTMGEWQNFWMSPAIMAGIVLVVFALLFWDRTELPESDGDS